ncbi:hypothetical protein D3C85_1692800 [compost metagenome]
MTKYHEHGRESCHLTWEARIGKGLGDACSQAIAEHVHAIGLGLGVEIQGNLAGRHSDRVGREGPAPGQQRLAFTVVEHLHELARAGHCPHRETTTNDLR